MISALTDVPSASDGQVQIPSKTWRDIAVLPEEEFLNLIHRYKTAFPYPHLIVENIFPATVLEEVVREFDIVGPITWRSFQSGLQQKRGTTPNTDLPPAAQEYFNLLYSGPFLRFLSRLTGITDLIPDPALFGGGMHEVSEGGRFEIHIDFQRHPQTNLQNRLAVITYLNHDWHLDDGGSLELWSTNPPICGARVIPTFGRTIIMEQSQRAAHGHPALIRPGLRRRALIAYFYTNSPEALETADSNTIYISHSGQSLRQRCEIVLRLILPPIVIRGFKSANVLLQKRRARSR
jgi:2OG-Fe(II) oxygenase superfamily